MRSSQQIVADLRMFLCIVASLVVLGLLFIYSSSSIYALEKFGSSHYFVKRQLIGIVVGFCGLIAFRLAPLDLIKKISPLFFGSSLMLTALTLTPWFARRIHGSSRWLNLFGFSFQPSELLKISFIIYVAYLLAKKEHNTLSFWYSFAPLMIVLGITSALLLKQPDFGLTVALLITTFALLFVAQFKTKHLLATLALALPACFALIYWRPYRLKRIITFLNPWDDPQGAGFQIIQSLIAIGSGSFWGTGISHSKQKFFYLPMQHTDFIFAIIAEETGFFGSCLLISLYVLFTYFGMRIVWQIEDMFGAFVVLGFVVLTSLQAIINIAVATGLAPTKGMGMPFISYGNSALVCSLWMIGLIINIVYENRSRNYV